MEFGNLEINENSKRRLSAAFESGRLSHAVLLTGGTKKLREATAKTLAMAILCESDKRRPCRKCRSCELIKKDFHPDVKIIGLEDKKTTIPIDTIREIKRQSILVPHQAPYQIFIINDADSMQEPSQNALLKILEEPPDSAKFILTANNKTALRETVLSRVETFSLSDDTGFTVGERENAKVAAAARDYAGALASRDEYRALIAVAPMVKDRKNFVNFCEKVILILRDSLVFDKGGERISGEDDAAKRLREKYDDTELIEMIQNIQKRATECARNVSMGLLGSCIVADNF